MIPLVFTEDALGRVSGEGMRCPDAVDFVGLVAGTGKTLAVPSAAKHVLFNRSANFFAKYASDALGTGTYMSDSSDATGTYLANAAELNPTGRTLTGISALSMIAPDGASITLSWFG